MSDLAYHFAESLRALLAARTADQVNARWREDDVVALGWTALRSAMRAEEPAWQAAMDEVDGLLLRLLDRLPLLARGHDRAAVRLRTFRIPELERLQHAAAAGLVAQRYGLAGLHTVLADGSAPLARRYFAFLALAERHAPGEWPLFARYLNPVAHHAFVGTAAEAARFYPERGATPALIGLFEGVRRDQQLRAFLSPRILESLYVLADPRTLPFFRDLLVAGYTDPDPTRCEVTRALVMVRRFTGRVEESSKFPLDDAELDGALDAAERRFERERAVLQAVAVI